MLLDRRCVYVAGESPAHTLVRPHNGAERFAGRRARRGAFHKPHPLT